MAEKGRGTNRVIMQNERRQKQERNERRKKQGQEWKRGEGRKVRQERQQGEGRKVRQERQRGEERQVRQERQQEQKRIESADLCNVARKCGGCQYIEMPYEQQLREKQKTVERLLQKYGKVNKIIGMKDPKHYRNKVHAVFDYQKGKGIVSGIYQEKSHLVVPVEECLLEDRRADAIIRSVRELAKSFKFKIYDEDTGYGLLRHVMVRVGYNTGQIMVILVLSSPVLPSRKNFVNALCKLHPEITTIVLNVNNKNTSMVLGEKEHVLYGKGYIEDCLCGRMFRISSKSFYQVNTVQTQKLYEKAIEYAGLTGKETVIDAYCGIGTIGLAAAEYAGKIIGVELSQAAVKDAVVNAKINAVKNVDFYQNDAGKFMMQLAEAREKVDVVFMDPPRSGSTEEFMKALLCLQPDRIVYISCNPETLARDLAYLTGKETKKENGGEDKKESGIWYRVVEMTPVDMFPFTGHVEACVLLTHKKPTSYIEVTMDYDKIVQNQKPRHTTYKMITEYVKEKYNLVVKSTTIADIKRSFGLEVGDYNVKDEKTNYRKEKITPEKRQAVEDALRYFGVIE